MTIYVPLDGVPSVHQPPIYPGLQHRDANPHPSLSPANDLNLWPSRIASIFRSTSCSHSSSCLWFGFQVVLTATPSFDRSEERLSTFASSLFFNFVKWDSLDFGLSSVAAATSADGTDMMDSWYKLLQCVMSLFAIYHLCAPIALFFDVITGSLYLAVSNVT